MIYLASASPRRQELLRQIGLEFHVVPSHIDEIQKPGEPPRDYVRRVAADKARAVATVVLERGLAPHPVLGADTEVVMDGAVLGKPCDRAHARRMLAQLAGRSHEVLSALCLLLPERTVEAQSESRVTLAPMSTEQIERYVASGEADDKAGGYAIQGRAAVYIRRLEGSYSGVMGLPLYELHEAMERAGIRS